MEDRLSPCYQVVMVKNPRTYVVLVYSADTPSITRAVDIVTQECDVEPFTVLSTGIVGDNIGMKTATKKLPAGFSVTNPEDVVVLYTAYDCTTNNYLVTEKLFREQAVRDLKRRYEEQESVETVARKQGLLSDLETDILALPVKSRGYVLSLIQDGDR